MRVLVIDDQLDAARLLVILLKMTGYDAEHLEENWEHLVAEVEARRPDLLILDVRLPDVDGLELVRQLRAHSNPEIAGVPVLLASALDHRHDAKLVGANGFLMKPYTRDSLMKAIQIIQEECSIQ